MAPLRIPQLIPRTDLAEIALPAALREALVYIFSHLKNGSVWLVGGTALAGYYAAHRRSDDLDLFAKDAVSYEMAVRAVRSLKGEGAIFVSESRSPVYYHAEITWRDHHFTVDVAVDETLHTIGTAAETEDGVWVADMSTLLAMKIACLVSRCSEKDLFDLDWLFTKLENYTIGDVIAMGQKVDGGLTAETLLISLQGTRLRKEACHFLLPHDSLSVEETFKKIIRFKEELTTRLLDYEKKISLSQVAQAITQSVRDQKVFSK